MVTMVVLPAARRGDMGPSRFQIFEAIERRFTWYARPATVIVGLTGRRKSRVRVAAQRSARIGREAEAL
jgi:hypothetical protein